MKISYSIDLHERAGAYFVSVHVEGEQAHEVGPMYDLAMAERAQNTTAARVRALIQSKGRVARQYTMTPINTVGKNPVSPRKSLRPTPTPSSKPRSKVRWTRS